MKKTILLVLVSALIISLIPRVVEAKLVACVGASGTKGFGLPDPINDCYPAQLEKLLRQFDPRWETRNFGVNGTTVLRQGELPYIDTTEYAEVLSSEPDVVILGLGGNAAWLPNRTLIEESYVSDFISLIDTFTALPSKPEIWLCYPSKVFNVLYKSEDEIIKNQIIPLITQIASEKELPIIDFYTAFENSPEFFQRDGIHLNLDGTKLMAEMISSFLTGVRVNPDLNSDGIVDSVDMCIIVDNWHTNEPSCDLVPPPFGDGIVDVRDLVALAEYLFTYPGRVAYWKLDETEGNIACDSAFDHNGTLVNGPLWQPSGGVVSGSLLFDGIDDYVSTEFVLNPADGAFSVSAWIKGGAPGQAIISQTSGKDDFNWLCVDASEGNLMTELRYVSRGGSGAPLVSQTPIIDDVWHRVGLSWDGTNRILYVDDVEVAKDTQPGLVNLRSGLYIGTGRNRESGTFWSGLIDDICIYNRAVRP